MSHEDKQVFKHESYGMVAFHRISGSPRQHMFGSNMEDNPTVIRLEVKTGERHHENGVDWFFGKDVVLRADLTPAQFAEMVSNPNVGSGVPCTLVYADGAEKARPPRAPTTGGSIRARFLNEVSGLADKVRQGRAAVEATLSGVKSISAGRRHTVLQAYDDATRFMHDAGPYLVDAFREAMQGLATEAKLEVDAFVQTALHRAGMDAAKKPSLMLDVGAVEEQPKQTSD